MKCAECGGRDGRPKAVRQLQVRYTQTVTISARLTTSDNSYSILVDTFIM